MIMRWIWVGWCGAAVLAWADSPATAIQDNSFLIEEAYNQGPTEVQHIVTVVGGFDNDRTWEVAFAQEWPLFSQAHQVSYAIPYVFQTDAGRTTEGWGDSELGYRWQAWTETERRPAVAPSVTLQLPSGSEGKGLGTGSVGYGLLVPVSKVLTDRLTAHFNAGLTVFPDDEVEDVALGGSVVLAVSETFNLLAELICDWEETRPGHRSAAVVISPGARYAINFAAGPQLVLGAALPVGLTAEATDLGVFFYLSLEHDFRAAPGNSSR
jgi:hypothetical protein